MKAVALGLIGAAGAGFAYVGWSLYRLAIRVLEDPDSERLLDGE